MGFKYKKRSEKDHKKRTEKQAGHWARLVKLDFPEWKPKEGKNKVRILPPGWEDAKHYGIDLWVNSNVGSDNETYLSLKLMRQEPDPVAEAIAAAKADGEAESVKTISPYRKVGMWVLVADELETGPQFFAMAQKLDREIAQLAYDDEDGGELILIDHHQDGCWVTFKAEGVGFKRTYTNIKLGKPGPITKDDDQQDEWLEFIQENTIPDVLNFYTYDHIKAALAGGSGTRKEDEDEELPERRRGTRNRVEDDEDDEPPKRRSAKIEDEDEELDEEPPKRRRRSEPEDDEESPKKRRRSQKAEPEDDEDDEPPKRRRQAEPEDLEDPPKRRRRSESEDDEVPKKRGRGRAKIEDDDENDDRDLRKSGGLKPKRRRRNSDDD